MFYLLFGTSNRHNMFARYLMPSYSCMGVVSACLFGIGMGIALERAQGWLELKQASPMPRFAYLAAKTISCAAFALVIVAALVTMGVTLGGVTLTVGEGFKLALVVLAGSIPFTAMGLLVALLVPPNAGPGVINLIYLPMSFASGFWMPVTYLPALAAHHRARAADVSSGPDRPEHLWLRPVRQHVDPLGSPGRIYPVDAGCRVDHLHPQRGEGLSPLSFQTES